MRIADWNSCFVVVLVTSSPLIAWSVAFAGRVTRRCRRA
jgi:hypothetical protein